MKITTFNLENLYNRYQFLDKPWDERSYEKYIQAVGLASIASRKGDLVSYDLTAIQRNNTANAILDADPDILAVQEIENLYTLRIFNDTYLDNFFGRMISFLGNDSRGINVGLAIRKGFECDVLNIRTHSDDGVIERKSVEDFGYIAKGEIFSRDCLEVDIMVKDKVLTLLVNHFKAQDRNVSSVKKRRRQAEEVLKIALKAADGGKYPIVLGDLNMDPGNPQSPNDNSLDPLLNSHLLYDPFPNGTWTHYYVPEKKVSRLDYILPHRDLNVVDKEIIRKGLTTKCIQYKGERYSTIGQQHTEASDHCPVSITIDI